MYGIVGGRLTEESLHGRSGRVALPRVKLRLARAALLELEGVPARRATRAAELRNNVADIVQIIKGFL